MKRRTKSPWRHPPLSDAAAEIESIASQFEGTSGRDSQPTSKQQCLARDGNRCIVTSAYDRNRWDLLSKSQKKALSGITGITNAAHVFPFRLGSEEVSFHIHCMSFNWPFQDNSGTSHMASHVSMLPGVEITQLCRFPSQRKLQDNHAAQRDSCRLWWIQHGFWIFRECLNHNDFTPWFLINQEIENQYKIITISIVPRHFFKSSSCRRSHYFEQSWQWIPSFAKSNAFEHACSRCANFAHDRHGWTFRSNS